MSSAVYDAVVGNDPCHLSLSYYITWSDRHTQCQIKELMQGLGRCTKPHEAPPYASFGEQPSVCRVVEFLIIGAICLAVAERLVIR